MLKIGTALFWVNRIIFHKNPVEQINLTEKRDNSIDYMLKKKLKGDLSHKKDIDQFIQTLSLPFYKRNLFWLFCMAAQSSPDDTENGAENGVSGAIGGSSSLLAENETTDENVKDITDNLNNFFKNGGLPGRSQHRL